MAMGYDLSETGSGLPLSIIVCEMSYANTCLSCANCNLNVSNNRFSDFLTSPERVCKGGVKVSG